MVDDYESIPYQVIPSLPLQKRFSITVESETGYSPEEAITQARRCLQCQLNIMIDPSICILCSGCVDICPYDCISMEGLTRVVKGDPLHQLAEVTGTRGADMIIDEEKCIRCGLCIVRCPTDAISMVQFEVKSRNDRWNVSKIPGDQRFTLSWRVVMFTAWQEDWIGALSGLSLSAARRS